MSNQGSEEELNKIYDTPLSSNVQAENKTTSGQPNESTDRDKNITYSSPSREDNIEGGNWLSEEEKKFYKAKTTFYRVLYVIIPVIISVGVLILLTIFAQALQPIAKLEERTNNLNEKVSNLEQSINDIRNSLIPVKKPETR